jgi:hypothetical protein
MHHQRVDNIDDKAPVWVVMRGPDGRLQDQLDLNSAAALYPAQSAEEIAETLVTVAGEMEMASSRLW